MLLHRRINKIDISLSCLSRSSIETVRNSGSIDFLIPLCSRELRTILGQDFGKIDEELLRVMLATIVAGNFADYGSSSAVTFQDIAESRHLNCGNTIFLVGYLFGTLASKKIRSVGFNGGFMGNHAQLFYTSGDKNILLDPTTGLIAQTNFDDLMRGVPLSGSKIRSFTIRDKTIDGFRQKVYRAVSEGRYEPSDFTYMHASLLEQFQDEHLNHFFSPGAIEARENGNRQTYFLRGRR